MIRLNRELLQQLSEQHLGDAQVLLEQKRWPGAYYLAGCAVECALKACIAKLTKAHDFPHKDSAKVFTHKFDILVGLAELETARIERCKISRAFDLYWAHVGKWSEESRYDSTRGEQEAHDLIRAISDNQEGVLPWIKLHW
jgi:HEPN domain-containing protein